MKAPRIIVWLLVMNLLLSCTAFSAGAEDEFPKVGEYITFGTYEQDNNLENGPESIEWQVLKVEDGRAMVLSRYVLELKAYHHIIAVDSSVSWETWDIRAWLNKEFFEGSFNEEEIARIPTVIVETPVLHHFANVPPINDTEDKVFLLSYQEASRYLKGGKARKCQPTEYAIANYETIQGKEWNRKMSVREADYGNCLWWLRSSGEFPGSAMMVGSDGGINGYIGYLNLTNLDMQDYNYGIRPAMWIDLTP